MEKEKSSLPKRPPFAEYEKKLYQFWEEEGFFRPEINPQGKPYTIILPPPNANGDLHVGHAMFVIEDLLIRWRRMQGYQALWVPGTDHAGFETQYVFEKELQKKGQTRFDFDRQTLYQKIFSFVEKNSGVIQNQLRALGFSLDWSREAFTLDPPLVEQVCQTFAKMAAAGLIYRDNYLVNYCPHFGTTFADLEVKYVEKEGRLWYLAYPLVGENEKFIPVATTRPETMLGDTAVAVHPQDQRYRQWIGREVELPLMKRRLPVIADESVDPQFGSGAVKVTPAHDADDFALARRHQLPLISIFNLEGRLNQEAGPYAGLTVAEAREKILADLRAAGFILKEEKHRHRVMVSYKGQYPIEPLVLPNWFVDMQKPFPLSPQLQKKTGKKEASLAELGIMAVKKGWVKIIPPRFSKIYFQWLENIRPWPISRQIVWGIRLPVWYSIADNPNLYLVFINSKGKVIQGQLAELLQQYSLEEIKKGLQRLVAPVGAKFVIATTAPGEEYLQETDVFDTWFSSGQWPLLTLGFPAGSDFQHFYPTAVLDTMWDILFFWVTRMIMLGLYLSGEVPFRVVYLHSMVTDEKGAKMSKSKGNVIEPLSIAREFSVDALRMSLLVGSAPGNPVSLSREKVKGFRNFTTKVWNASRFLLQQIERTEDFQLQKLELGENLTEKEKDWLNETQELVQAVTQDLEKFRFSAAGEKVYQFFWHRFCDFFLEESKTILYQGEEGERRQRLLLLSRILLTLLKLLHPFMPFISEQIYQYFRQRGLADTPEYRKALMISQWPNA